MAQSKRPTSTAPPGVSVTVVPAGRSGRVAKPTHRLPAPVVLLKEPHRKPDFGPGLRRVTTIPNFDPERVIEKEDRRDPTLAHGPMLRGGRVRDPILRMFNSQQITKRAMNAVEAFRDDIAIANGAREDQMDNAGVRTGYSGGMWPAEAQLTAMRRVSRTWDLMTEPQQLITAAVISQRRTLDEYAAGRMRRETASEILYQVIKLLELRHPNRSLGRRKST
jgi:hypothetical protein